MILGREYPVMPMIKHRKVRVTLEYDAQGPGSDGELADRITIPLEAASRGLVKDLESDVSSCKVVFVSVENLR